MRNKFRGPSPRPQAHSRPFSRTPSPPPCSATFVRCVVVFFLLSGCSDDPLPERAAAGPTCLPRPHSFATAATTSSPPLPTGPDWALLPVRLGSVSHLNGTIPGAPTLCDSQNIPRKQRRRKNRAGGEVMAAAASFLPGPLSFSLSGAPHLILCGTARTRFTALL